MRLEGQPIRPLMPCHSQELGISTVYQEVNLCTNLTVADRWGNVVEYTLTIEQTGGSGMVVPGHGFLLSAHTMGDVATFDREFRNLVKGYLAP